MVALATVLFFLVCPRPAIAHDPLLDLPEPKSVPEAWDVIRQSVENVGKLLETNQLKPIAFQIANCSPAIRRLQSELGDRADRQELREKLEAMYASGGSVILATRDKQSPLEKAQALYKTYKAAWDAIAERYPPELRTSAVYNCPMHPLDRHLKETDRCTICSMKLNRRRIPSSTTYEKPGGIDDAEAGAHASAEAGRPIDHQREAGQIGRRTGVAGRSAGHAHRARAPADRGFEPGRLSPRTPHADRHPGEYEFAITPRLPGEYRVFADVVPGATGVQEYVVGDIPRPRTIATAIRSATRWTGCRRRTGD